MDAEAERIARYSRYSALLSFVITSLGVLFAIPYIFYLLFSSTSLGITRLQSLPVDIPEHLKKVDLLFGPSGEPTMLVENFPYLDVYTWKLSPDGEYSPSKIPIPFGQLIGPSQPVSLVSPFTTATNSPLPPPQQGLPYAISDDTSMIAWSWGGSLIAGPLAKPQKIKRPLMVPSPVVDISFLSSDLVAILHSSGELFLERLSQPDPNLPGTRLDPSIPPREPWRISGKGSFRCLSRPNTNYGILLNGNDKKTSFQGFPSARTRTFITTSPQGQVAVGTSTSRIFFPKPFGKAPSVVLPEAKKVQTLAFYDEQHVIASLEGGDLFMVEDQERVRRLDTAPADVKLVALQGSRIVMATSRSVTTGTLERHLQLSDLSKWKLALTLSVLGGLGFLRLWGLDVISLIGLIAQHRQAQAKDQSEQATAESGEGEERSGTEPETSAATQEEQEPPPL